MFQTVITAGTFSKFSLKVYRMEQNSNLEQEEAVMGENKGGSTSGEGLEEQKILSHSS